MKKLLLALSFLGLSACSTLTPPPVVAPPPQVKTVVIPCVSALPPRPEFPLQDANPNEDLFTLTKKSLAEIELRKAYEAELRASLTACMK